MMLALLLVIFPRSFQLTSTDWFGIPAIICFEILLDSTIKSGSTTILHDRNKWQTPAKTPCRLLPNG